MLACTVGCSPADPALVGTSSPSPDIEFVPCRRTVIPRIAHCETPAPPCEGILNPDQLIDIGLQNNPQTKQSWHNARAAAYNVGVAKSGLYPAIAGSETISAVASHGVGGGSSGTFFADSTGSDTSIGTFVRGGGGRFGNTQSVTSDIALTYLLWDFGGRCAQIEMARDALMTANWTHNRTIQNVILSVLNGYYSYEGFEALVQARELDLKDAETSAEAAQAQFEMGVATKVDVLQAMANYVNAKLQLETARGQMNTAMGQLATAIGWPANTQLELTPLPERLDLDAISENMCTLLETAKVERPDLAATYATYLQAKANVVVAQSSSRPTVSFNGDAQRTDFFHLTRLNGSSQSATVVLNVPIFAGGLYQNQIASAKESALAAYAAWKNQEQTVLLDVVTNYNSYTTALESVQYSEEYLKFAQEAYDAALLGYRNGTSSILDLLTAQTTLSDARSQRIQARTQFLTALVGVAYALGTL